MSIPAGPQAAPKPRVQVHRDNIAKVERAAPLPWEATAAGLQYVVPGCEKDPDKGPAQGALF